MLSIPGGRAAKQGLDGVASMSLKPYLETNGVRGNSTPLPIPVLETLAASAPLLGGEVRNQKPEICVFLDWESM